MIFKLAFTLMYGAFMVVPVAAFAYHAHVDEPSLALLDLMSLAVMAWANPSYLWIKR